MVSSNESIGVIVQEMIFSEVSGVLFTKNPVENDENQIIIEVVEGLCSKLVSGEADANTYVISKETREIIESFFSEDNKGLLTTSELEGLVDSSLTIEKLMGCPIDIEFGFKDGKLYFFQERPITT